MSEVIRKMVLTSHWYIIGGSRDGDRVGLCNTAVEHCCTLHRDVTPIKDLCMGREDYDIIRPDAVVVAKLRDR